MNTRAERIARFALAGVFFSLLVVSCRKETEPDYQHFISSSKISSYELSTITALLALAADSIPEADLLIPFIANDIDIYKVVYKTTIKGRETNASGLVCVPEEPGNYPVLSFQNGTNTLHSNAPSVSPANFLIVEAIASMGYVVTIADYPGFGESSELTHPYLVAEPTVQSLVDLLYAVKEMDIEKLNDISLTNDVYVTGYSQGGWASLQLHKSLELDYNDDFTLKGSCCGAGPYNIYLLLQDMVGAPSYPEPVYIGYILNSYKAYDQFTSPVTDIMNEPYASRLPSLFTGQLNFGQINSQLTTSIPGLIKQDFLTGFANDSKYASVREALLRNSISAWHTNVPLLLIHGGSDTQVFPSATENMYSAMLQAGTSADIIKKVIIPGADHGDGVVPAMIQGLIFLENIKSQRK